MSYIGDVNAKKPDINSGDIGGAILLLRIYVSSLFAMILSFPLTSIETRVWCQKDSGGVRSTYCINCCTLGQKSSIHPKIHILKVSYSTKFTISNFHFSQNLHFQNLIFQKIHIFKVSLLTKFTFLEHQNQRIFRIKSLFLPFLPLSVC